MDDSQEEEMKPKKEPTGNFEPEPTNAPIGVNIQNLVKVSVILDFSLIWTLC